MTARFFYVIIIMYAYLVKNIHSHRIKEDDMKHCFILNPYAGKGAMVEELKEKIKRICEEKKEEF